MYRPNTSQAPSARIVLSALATKLCSWPRTDLCRASRKSDPGAWQGLENYTCQERARPGRRQKLTCRSALSLGISGILQEMRDGTVKAPPEATTDVAMLPPPADPGVAETIPPTANLIPSSQWKVGAHARKRPASSVPLKVVRLKLKKKRLRASALRLDLRPKCVWADRPRIFVDVPKLECPEGRRSRWFR